MAKVADILQHLPTWVQASGHAALDADTQASVHARVSSLVPSHPVYLLMARRAQDELRRRFQDEAAQLKANTGLDVVAKAMHKWTAVIVSSMLAANKPAVITFDVGSGRPSQQGSLRENLR